MSSIVTTIAKAIAPLRRRVGLMVMRGLVELVKDDKKLQAIQFSGLVDFVRDDVEHFQPYGFTSYPKVGAEAIVVMVGGNTDHPVCIVVDDRRTRPRTLAEGESAMWTAADGLRVVCKANGDVEIGTNPTESIPRDDHVQTELKALRDYVRDHEHPAPTASGGQDSMSASFVTEPTISTIAKPASPPPAVGATKSDQGKIK